MPNRTRLSLGILTLLFCAALLPGQAPESREVRLIVKFAESAVIRQSFDRQPESIRSGLNGCRLRELLAGREAQSYRDSLRQIQEDRLEQLRAAVPGLRAGHRYQYAFNGASVSVPPEQVEALARQPGVLAVYPGIRLVPEDEYTEQIIDLPAAWNRLAQEYRLPRPGEGTRIALIDTGVILAHPSFNDAGFSAPAGFPVSEVVADNLRTPLPPGSTNNKVIVANVYKPPQDSTIYTRALSTVSATHGSAVAATAAGVPVKLDDPSKTAVVQGVAPYAYLLSLVVAATGSTPEYLAAIDDAARYGADALNISQGSPEWLAWAEGRNPLQEALEALAEAGVVVCLSAGNSGASGAGTLTGAFKFSDQILVVGAQNSGRAYATGAVSAAAPMAAASSAALKSIGLVSSFPFQSPVRARLQPTVTVQDTFGHVNDSFSRRAYYPFPPGSLSGKIALAESGSIAGDFPSFATQWAHVRAGGAIALLVYNSASPGDPNYVQAVPALITNPYAFMERTGGVTLDEAFQTYGSALEVEIARSNLVSAPQSNSIAGYSSRGPTPRLRIKPDLVAPATNVLLPAFSASGGAYQPAGFSLGSGTSLASPLVAGAAALLQQAHPEWSARQLRAALVTTTENQVAPSRSQVDIASQGAGSLRVDAALHPGLHVSPYTLSLGTLAAGQRRTALVHVADARPSADSQPRTYRISAAPATSGPAIQVEVPQLTLAGGQQGYFTVSFSTTGLAPGDYGGHLILSQTGGTTQSLPYFFRVAAASAGDVLLVFWRGYESTPSNRQRYEAMLAQAGLKFDVLEIRVGEPMPALQVLQRYRLVVLATGDTTSPFTEYLPGGSYPWQGYLLAGGRLLVTGNAYNMRINVLDPTQGSDWLLSSSASGFYPSVINPVPGSASRATIRLSGLLGNVDLSSGSGGDGAGNQKGIDLGRPIAAADSALVTNAAELAPQARKLLAASEISVDGSPLSLSATADAAATGVWPEATLERPSAGVSWAAAFLAFGLEGVNTVSGQLSGADLFTRLYRWLTDDLKVRLDLRDLGPGKTATLRAVVSSSLPGNAGERYRWDFGDGSPVVSGSAAEISHAYAAWPARPPRVEVTDSLGHTAVSPASVYLPFLSPAEAWSVEMRVFNTGTQTLVPVFLAFDDSGTELARRNDRSILPGGCLSMNLAELFPSIVPGIIQHVRIDAAGGLEALAVVVSNDGEEMTSIPGQHYPQPLIYVPHISQAVSQYYTRYALIRAAEASGAARFEGNGAERAVSLPAAAGNQLRQSFADLFGGRLPPALDWGAFRVDGGAASLVGAELFGRVDGARQLAAMPLDGSAGKTLSFVHVSSDSELFWTGMVYANVGTATANVTVRSYSANGQLRTVTSHTLSPGAKQVLLYDRKTTTTVPLIALSFSADVAWVQVQSDAALIGYELFGTVDDSRLEGLTAPAAGARRLLFPYLANSAGSWTGIAVVNLSGSATSARLKALDPAGKVLATVTRNYAAFAKDLGLAGQLFGGRLPVGTTHLLLESEGLLWGFELFGDDAGRRMGGANAFPLP